MRRRRGRPRPRRPGGALDDATRRSEDEGRRATEGETRRTTLEAGLATIREALAAAQAQEAASVEAREAARLALEAADGTRRAAAERAARAGTALAGIRGQVDALERRLADEEARGIAKAARRAGGRRVDDDLGVEPGLRAAVEAALGELARAYVVDGAAVAGMGGERGQLAVRERIEAFDKVAGGGSPSELRRLDDTVASVHGGRLRDAIRRDPGGAARALLERAVWAPDLEAALRIQPSLPVGWVVATRDGGAVLDAVSVRIGRGDSPLEARAEAERLGREAEARSGEAAEAEQAVALAERAVAEATGVARGARARRSPPRSRQGAAWKSRNAPPGGRSRRPRAKPRGTAHRPTG